MAISFAWETTPEDVENVLDRLEIDNAHGKGAFNLFDDEDFDRIEKAALYGNNMNQQTEYALEQIQVILIEKGKLFVHHYNTERWEWKP